MKGDYNISSIAAQDLDNPASVFEDLIAHQSPFAVYLFNWMDFQSDAQQFFVELVHDIALADGTVITNCYPSQRGWTELENPSVCHSHENVQRVRLAKQQPMMSLPWQHRGHDGALSAPL